MRNLSGRRSGSFWTFRIWRGISGAQRTVLPTKVANRDSWDSESQIAHRTFQNRRQIVQINVTRVDDGHQSLKSPKHRE